MSTKRRHDSTDPCCNNRKTKTTKFVTKRDRELAILTATNARLQGKLEKTLEQLEEARRQLETQTSQIVSVTEVQVDYSQSKESRYIDEINILSKGVLDLTRNNQQLELQLTKTLQAMRSVTDEHESLKKENTRLRRERNKAEDDLKVAEDDLDNLADKLQAERERVAQKNVQLRRKEDELKVANKDNDYLTKNLKLAKSASHDERARKKIKTLLNLKFNYAGNISISLHDILDSDGCPTCIQIGKLCIECKNFNKYPCVYSMLTRGCAKKTCRQSHTRWITRKAYYNQFKGTLWYEGTDIFIKLGKTPYDFVAVRSNNLHIGYVARTTPIVQNFNLLTVYLQYLVLKQSLSDDE